MKLSNTYIDQDLDIWFVSINNRLFFKLELTDKIIQSRSRHIDNAATLVLRHNLTKLTKG